MVDSRGISEHPSPVASSISANRRGSGRTKKVSGRRRAVKPQSLLILHLNAAKLRVDDLHLGDVAQYSAAISSVALRAEVVLRETTSLDELHCTLAELNLEKKTFDVIVVVAHSNADGVRIASDMFVDWAAFAAYLKPFSPRRLLLVACKAGRSDAGDALFSGLRTLRRIFACPVNASKNFGAMMFVAVPYVVANRKPKDKHVLWSQIAAVAATGCQLREWRRTTDAGNPESSVFDHLADLADPFARELPSALGAVVRKVVGR